MLDKQMTRLERKIDMILDKLSVKYEEPEVKPVAAPKLSELDQQAIDNAPATPAGVNAPAMMGARMDATTNAPVTPAAQPKSGAKSGAKRK